jgi:hypothetical protein
MHDSSTNAIFQRPLPCGWRRILGLMAGLFSLLFVNALFLDAAYGAGCHYANPVEMSVQSARPGAMPNWTAWGAKRVIRRYEGGRFTYYAFSEANQPCRGASCHGSPTGTTFTDSATIEPTRQTLQCGQPGPSLTQCVTIRSARCTDEVLPEAPLLAGILRPPCA